MAWGDSKKELLIAENAAMSREIEMLRDQIADLRRDKTELRDQLKATQEALIAKESPEAYHDKKYAEEQASQPAPSEELLTQRKFRRQQAEVASRYINEMEGSLFKDADDMIQMLTRGVGVPVISESKSLHGNNES